ncbi:methylenetetrahydrofolate reductase [NAD(P)H] [Thiocystis violascens]|uniref:Methylenetetrahydrofolate reductase n=1 Tax=Thiocystis violascens (strain ATCC 17096 / DSM 198 / 6111) TaxID=765911 RepID=I3YEM6_THIV6|nr:methylenetetrahydrofolate reductase [NAD(P)H] [Thiocystis violascens]AFL75444.1 5,10-methylenetetrahydrofolate reductase [Thiocystis violascens DSM 198]
MLFQNDSTPLYSVELFPPKTAEGMDKLKLEIAKLNALGPAYFSVTYGAGGSTREGTLETVSWLRGLGIETAPHLACIGSTREQVRELLNHYRQQGIRRLVALRGDMPSGMGAGNQGDFRYANELVTFVRAEFGDAFHIEVAAYPEYHPQSGSPARDLENFKRKVEAGADGAITQYFYSADAYFAFVASCRKAGVEIPIIPGIMPITNYTQLARFSDTCGAEIPRWVRRRLEGYGDDVESIRAFGHEVVLTLCRHLIEGGAPGLHFYTMNQSGPTTRLWNDLELAIVH